MNRLALNQNSCKNLSLFEFLKYSKNFEGVELNFKIIKKSLSNTLNLKDISEILETYDTRISSIFRLKDFSLSSEREYNTKILINLREIIDFCYKLEVDLLIVNPSPLKDFPDSDKIPPWRIFKRTRRRLEDICKIASKYDINIGFEFLTTPDSSISTLSEAKEVINPLESQENLGYVIDSFHFAKSNAGLNQLNEIKDLIFLIQLSDINDDLERIFPGNGNYDVQELINYAKKIGYRDFFSIELSKNSCSKRLYKKFLEFYSI